MKKPIKVLVFPAGTEIGLEIWRALKDCKEIELYAAESVESSHTSYVYGKRSLIPDARAKGFISALNGVIQKNGIDMVFPAHDDVVTALAENVQAVKAKVVSSPLDTCLTCRYKTRTYLRFEGLLPVPRIFNRPSDVKSFPVFVKPDRGQGSKDAVLVKDMATLKTLLENDKGLIVMENLPGKEYTVDCFSDRKRGLLFSGGRERIRVRSGISMDSAPVDRTMNAVFRKYAEIISRELEFHGAWFFQLKADRKGTLKLLEAAPRIGGAMAVHRVLGVNFPLLSVYENEGGAVKISPNCNRVRIDRALVNRYRHDIDYSRVYVDFDDTLIVRGKVNAELVKMLYQSLNKGRKIILITRTAGDIKAALKKYRLRDIFDEVISIKKNGCKADFIKPRKAIFIDDSFSERMTVAERHGIPTFDLSMIEMLMDERI